MRWSRVVKYSLLAAAVFAACHEASEPTNSSADLAAKAAQLEKQRGLDASLRCVQ